MQQAQSKPDLPYAKLFWLTVPVLLTVAASGIYAVISLMGRVQELTEKVTTLSVQIDRLNERNANSVMIDQLVQDAVRVNIEQSRQITELRVWQARMDERIEMSRRRPQENNP